MKVLACLERDVRKQLGYELVDTLVEYRRERIDNRWRKETTDFVNSVSNPENKIVPDAGFVLRYVENGQRALFLIEVDRGTMRLTTEQDDKDVAPYVEKLAQYDRYLASGRVANRYTKLGTFSGFHLLTITTTWNRVESMGAVATTTLNH